MIHDYGNSAFKDGVREAINLYETSNSIVIPKVPIPDKNGTIVLTK